jgi:voltage-gated potassium channel
MRGFVDWIEELYESGSPRSHRFRYWLLAFDIATVIFVVATSFVPRASWIEVIDVTLGVLILADLAARMAISENRLRLLVQPATIADLIAIVSFLAPIAGEGFAFLRILRTLRLFRTYRLLSRLRQDFPFFRRNEDAIGAAINLGVFLFVMTGLIYTTQHRINPEITNYADSLYFTVTTLTTTGFGDITLQGTWGRMLSVAVMIFGVTLFLRLAQILFRPLKVRKRCRTCGLELHDGDALHCKHCGEPIKINTEGAV